MGAFATIRTLWMSMTGDMNGRYLELQHKRSHGELNDMEQNELESLEEKFGKSTR